jgi:hypothetical protein
VNPIWTLNGRDTVWFEVVFGTEDVNAQMVQRELSQIRSEASSALASRGVQYDQLRRPLSPQTDRREIAILFDSAVMDNWYGIQAAREIIPLLDRNSACSILTGDVIWPDARQAIDALLSDAEMFWVPRLQHPTQIYCVYLNNLTDAMVKRLQEGLRLSRHCFALVDCTYMSAAKAILSTCIGSRYLRHRNTFITEHPDDEASDANFNSPHWPLEEFGFRYISVTSLHFSLLLSYKIERPVLPDIFESDAFFSLAALSGYWQDLNDCTVEVAESKVTYLREHKADNLERAGLHETTDAALAELLLEKINQTYIYDLKVNDHGSFLFNSLIELRSSRGRARIKAGVEYLPAENKLRLVTMF